MNWSSTPTQLGTDSGPYAITYSPDETRVAIGDASNSTHVYATSDWSLETTLADPTGTVYGVAFSETHLAVASRDNSVYVYATSDWSLETTLTDAASANAYGVNGVAFTPDGSHLIGAGDDANGYVWSTSDWSLETTLTDPSDAVGSVAVSEDYLAIEDSQVYVYATSDWSLETTLTDADLVLDVAISPDNSRLAVGSGESIYVWSTSDWSLETTLTEPTDRQSAVAFTSDGAYLASGGQDGGIHIYATSEWNYVQTVDSSVRDLAFAPTSSDLAAAMYYQFYGHVYGQVTPTLSGAITDEANEPIEGALVYLLVVGGGPVVETTLTDANGEYSFEFEDGETGPYHVVAEFEDTDGWYQGRSLPGLTPQE